MVIIDAHAHVSNTDYGNTNLYLHRLEETGIALGVIVPGGMLDVRRMTDYIIGKAQPENPVPNNDYIEESCSNHQSELLGYICLDPHAPDALQQLQESVSKGFLGLKFSPMSHQFSFASKAIAELVACCGELGFPVYSHVLYNPGASTTRFVALARQFPNTNFILGHMGFGPADQEGLEAAVALDNFFLETSTGSYLHIAEAARKAGPTKIIFGSEFPLSLPEVELAKVLLLDISDQAKDLILGGNIGSLLHLNS